MAREALRSTGAVAQRKVTLDSIQRAVAEEFELNPARLQENTNARCITFPRQIAMYLCKQLTQASLP